MTGQKILVAVTIISYVFSYTNIKAKVHIYYRCTFVHLDDLKNWTALTHNHKELVRSGDTINNCSPVPNVLFQYIYSPVPNYVYNLQFFLLNTIFSALEWSTKT